jgi:predicted TIM-barrel fold metal-dependent hydrolase
VLSHPSPHQLWVLTALCDRAERVIVMTDTARRLLVEVGASTAEKIRVVPHGAPVVLGRRRDEHAAGRRPLYVAPAPGGYERMQSRFLLSTFGLLSAGKGLETAIEALPLIVERHPEATLILAHAGIADLQALATCMRGRKGVFFDTSTWSAIDLLDFYRRVPPEQVVYASDYPYGQQPSSLLLSVKTARYAGYDDDQLRSMLAGLSCATMAADGCAESLPGA